MKTTPKKKTAKKKTVAKKAAGRPSNDKQKTPAEIEALKERLSMAASPPLGEPNPEWKDAPPNPEWETSLPDPDDDYVPEGCEPPGKGAFRGVYQVRDSIPLDDDDTPGPFGSPLSTPEPAALDMAHSPTQPVQTLPGASQEAKKGTPTESPTASLEHFIETLHQADDAIAFLTKKARLLAPKDRRILADRRARIQKTQAQLKVQLLARSNSQNQSTL